MKRLSLIILLVLGVTIPLLGAGIDFDVNKPANNATVSSIPGYLRETRSDIYDFAVEEHTTAGKHAIPSATTTGLADETPSGGRLIYNSTTGALLYGSGSVWIGTNGAVNVPYAYIGTYSGDLTAALAALGSTTRATLVVDTTATISTHTTVPSNILLWFMGEGKVTLGAYNLTLSGNVNAERKQIFDCSGAGRVLRGTTESIKMAPEWWGAAADGATNDFGAFTLALTFAGVTYDSSLDLTPGKTYLSSGNLLTIPAQVEVVFNPGSKIKLLNHNIAFFSQPRAPSRPIFVYTGSGVAVAGLDGLYCDSAWFPTPLPDSVSFASTLKTTINVSTNSLTTDCTVPATATVSVKAGNITTIATTKTLTINGDVTAGRYQIFAWAGSGVVANLKSAFPEWFGALGDGSTDDTAALVATATGCKSGGIISFASRTYMTTGWLVQKSLSLVSDGPLTYGTSAATTLKAAGNQAYVLKLLGVITSADTFLHPTLRGINIDGDTNTISDAGFVAEMCHLFNISNCSFQNVAGRGIRMRAVWELRMRDFFIYNCGAIDTGAAFLFDGPSPLDYAYGSSNVLITGGVWSSNRGRWFQASSLANIDGLWFEQNKLEMDSLTTPNTVDTNVIHIGSMSRSSISNNTLANFGATLGKYANLIWIGSGNDDGNSGAAGNPLNIVSKNRYYGNLTAGDVNGVYLATNAAPILEEDNAAYLLAPAVLSVPNVNNSVYRQTIRRTFSGFDSVFGAVKDMPSVEHPGFVSIHKAPGSTSNVPVFITSPAPKPCVNDSNTVARFTTAGAAGYVVQSFNLARWVGNTDSHLIVRVRMRLDAAGDVSMYANPTAPGVWTAVPMGVASQNWEWYEFILTTSELTSTDCLFDLFLWAINAGTPKLLVDGLEFKTDNMVTETVTVGSPALLVTGIAPRIVNINSAGGAVTATLPDGTYIGQRIYIRMMDATTSSTVSVTHHLTSDPEVFTFATLGATVALKWNGTKWETIYNHGATL